MPSHLLPPQSGQGGCASQAAVLVFLPATAGAEGVAVDFLRHLDDVVRFGSFSDESVILLNLGNPCFIQEMVDHEQDAFPGNEIRARVIDAHSAHLTGQFVTCGRPQPTEVKPWVLPTETDGGHVLVVMDDMNHGFPAVTGVVGAVAVDKDILPVRQTRIAVKGDGSCLAFRAKDFSGWYER